MNCEQVQSVLGRFHDGELDQAERAAVEIHLGNCPNCAGELAAIAELAEVARSVQLPEPPKDLWGEIAHRLERERHWHVRRRLPLTAALAAAVLLAIGAGWLGFRRAGQ